MVLAKIGFSWEIFLQNAEKDPFKFTAEMIAFVLVISVLIFILRKILPGPRKNPMFSPGMIEQRRIIQGTLIATVCLAIACLLAKAATIS
jgi:hypothetical protein